MAITIIPLPEGATPTVIATEDALLEIPPSRPTITTITAAEVALMDIPAFKPRPSPGGPVTRTSKIAARATAVAQAMLAADASKSPRDSMRKRELLQRGREGTRRRQRWENDRLLNNPAFVAPGEKDFEPAQLWQRRDVPYQFAALWEHPWFPKHEPVQQKDEEQIPKELKTRLKKAPGARVLLESLELEVREFLELNEDDEENEEVKEEGETDYESSVVSDSGSDGDEIVFVSMRQREKERREKGKSGQKEQSGEAVVEKVLFRGELGDRNASFKRWMIHSIAAYYGLQSWSVTQGKPPIRYAYVAKTITPAAELKVPKPLYMML